MSSAFLQLVPFALVLFLLQGLAAIPWLMVVTRRSFAKNGPFYLKVVGGVTLGGLLFAFILQSNSDPGIVALWGRFYHSILMMQVGIDLFILTFFLLLTFWPKGGAVALAAFQEAVRQPMFWMLTGMGAFAMLISVYIPYFTFGEDLKMVKEISYALTMMFPALFGVISASISVAEEIEGRTAVTLLSKPVTRREFLFGKFIGITLAGMLMTMFMGWVLIWIVLYKYYYDFQTGITPVVPDPPWLTELIADTYGRTISGDLLQGIGLWLRDTMEALPGLIIGFGQVMTLIAVSVALATRVPMVVNISMCAIVYLLGHLTPIMTEVSQNVQLVHFVAQLFELLLPGLDLFDVGNAIIRDVPLDPNRYALYTFNVALYAVIYTAIANLVGLILFEDRDVA
jgi:ABC-type transport system involved in multi-copper enzyme maturation permease subunit